MCLRGSSEIADALNTMEDARLRAYAVWVPKVGGTESHVAQATVTLRDPRARHFWDGEGWTMRGFAPVLNIGSRDAWDVYLIYGPEARWDEDAPPRPRFWMHQLPGVTVAPELDAAEFAAQLRAIDFLPTR